MINNNQFRQNNGNFQNPQNSVNNFGNIPQMVSKFNEFYQNFQGNPQQMVQELLNSGKMSQAQFNSLSQQATQFMQFLRGR